MRMENNMDKALDVRVKIYPVRETGAVRAFASVILGGYFAVNGIRVVEGKKGLFVAMPSRKGPNDEYRDICCPITQEMRSAVDSAVLSEYETAAKERAAADREAG